ncbi:MAG: class I SAM-dependent methyltransferase [Salibacteraceae bacterium]
MGNLDSIKISRFDLSEDKSLKGWNTADEYLVNHVLENEVGDKMAIYHDRFGYLSVHLNNYSPSIISGNRSQEKAIIKNVEKNGLLKTNFHSPIHNLDHLITTALVKIPKSLPLFELYLWHIHKNSSNEVNVICAFMTKYFSKGMLKVAEKYFENVSQSRAVKKARLLELSVKKKVHSPQLISSIPFNNSNYSQYLGVFSAGHIDYATQFFLDHIDLSGKPKSILDLASGNGIIATEISKRVKPNEIHLMDDSYLAVESSKLNDPNMEFTHHYNNDMSVFKEGQFDLIVTNPPFHFEYDINIQVPITLLQSTFPYLKKGGSLQMVSNKHLNYKTHLSSVFSRVLILAENPKFVVYKCEK